jgi:hypothetical protein
MASGHLMTGYSKGVWVICLDAAEGVVHMGVAGLICPYCQDEVPHVSIIRETPVGTGNGGGSQTRPELPCLYVLRGAHGKAGKAESWESQNQDHGGTLRERSAMVLGYKGLYILGG